MSKDTKPMLDKGTIRMGTVTKIVLALAIIILAVSLVISFVKPDAASILLSFFSTVIVSWLISNDASEKENERTNKKKQEDLAKVSHRHLGDVERSALSIEQYIKDFTYDFESHQDMSADAILLFLKSLDSRMDDLKDRITSTNRDWYDLLADDVKKGLEKEIKESEDPEAKFIKPESLRMSEFLSAMEEYGHVISGDGTVEDEDNVVEKADI